MVDITNKSNTLRIATAQAIVKVTKPETIAAIENDTVPKGNVLSDYYGAGAKSCFHVSVCASIALCVLPYLRVCASYQGC